MASGNVISNCCTDKLNEEITQKTNVMEEAGDKSVNDNTGRTDATTGSPELHPLMAVASLSAAVELNRTNDHHGVSASESLTNVPMRGIDDGFLNPENGGRGEGDAVPRGDGPRERESPEERIFPRGPTYPESGHIPRGRGGVDINVYAHKKTLAQGMMDLALLSANANQLRYVLDTGPNHPYYYVGLVLISTSIFLQLAVGVGLIVNSRYNIRHLQDVGKANIINNFTVLGIFFVTMLNVFISAFGVGDVPTTPNLPGDLIPPERVVEE